MCGLREWVTSKLDAVLCKEDSRSSAAPILRRVFPYLWARLEARCTARSFEREFDPTQPYDELVRKAGDLVEEADENVVAEVSGLPAEVWESETRRIERLEEKAQTYIIGIMLTVGVASLAASLADSSGSPHFLVNAVLGLSVVNLLFAVLSALRVRRATVQQVPTVGDVQKSMEDGRVGETDQALLRLARAKWNEFPAHEKANWLIAAEDHFRWGTILVALGIAGTIFPSLPEGIMEIATSLARITLFVG